MSDGRSGCPINLSIEVIGDRWSLLVIRDMMFGNRHHFGELRILNNCRQLGSVESGTNFGTKFSALDIPPLSRATV